MKNWRASLLTGLITGAIVYTVRTAFDLENAVAIIILAGISGWLGGFVADKTIGWK